MKVLVGTFNQEKALIGAFPVIVQPVVEPMEHYTALIQIINCIIRSCPILEQHSIGAVVSRFQLF